MSWYPASRCFDFGEARSRQLGIFPLDCDCTQRKSVGQNEILKASSYCVYNRTSSSSVIRILVKIGESWSPATGVGRSCCRMTARSTQLLLERKVSEGSHDDTPLGVVDLCTVLQWKKWEQAGRCLRGWGDSLLYKAERKKLCPAEEAA
jgi:hypothetical protein